MFLPYDEARKKYQPDNIRCLFIGESRPAGGRYFFRENSNLYFATKEAFERAAAENFNCAAFQNMGCWLYDVCDVPVNNLGSRERKARILEGMQVLKQALHELNPKFVVVVKKGDFGRLVYPCVLASGYIDRLTSWLLPFPLYQYREQYVQELSSTLKKTIFPEN